MPIRPENLARYPKDWPAIAASIRERAGHRCEWREPDGRRCPCMQYAVGIWRKEAGLWRWVPEHGNGPCDAAGQGLRWPSLDRWTFSEARAFAADLDWDEIVGEAPKPIVIVLTVAHLDHQPENCDPANLRAWCQRHHLAYDHVHHQTNAQASRREKAGQLELWR